MMQEFEDEFGTALLQPLGVLEHESELQLKVQRPMVNLCYLKDGTVLKTNKSGSITVRQKGL